MHLKHTESGAVAAVEEVQTNGATTFTKLSSTLPLGQMVPLASISGPTYVTAQLLVQQVAYKLSDKIFSYSPPTFDLDIAVQQWSRNALPNIHGSTTAVHSLQTRTGAGAFTLGYMFSADFDLTKRHIPQTLLAPTLSLRNLRGSLDQLSLLYSVASPFVAHVAAAEYSQADGLVPDYAVALQSAEELGLGLVASSSAYEAQHMALFATLMAGVLPSLHVYDGIRTSRETLRVIDALGEVGIKEIYSSLSKHVQGLNSHLDTPGKVLDLLNAFNGELGTDYKPFEYFGDEDADTVLVVFGSVETQLANQVASQLSAEGKKVGAINVRLYRPFIEEAFLNALPASVQQIAVFGQVSNNSAVEDAAVQSILYSDVFTAVSFSSKWAQPPVVTDVKYAASDALTPTSLNATVQKLINKDGAVEASNNVLTGQVEQYTFWDIDNSSALSSPAVVSKFFTRESSSNVYVHETHDNLIQGGVIRTDVRSSKKTIEASYAVDEADVVYVGEEKILQDVDVLNGLKSGGKLLIRLPNLKDDELEKRISPLVRKAILDKSAQVFVLDSSFSPALETNLELLVELAFLQVARSDGTADEVKDLSAPREGTLQECRDALNQCLRQIETPATWADLPAEYTAPSLVGNIKNTSFVGFEKEEAEQDLQLSNWESAAKALAFKEAYGTQSELRPDLSVKTATVHVKENRRLTPSTYDRNIFHIEFDLGTSGVTYNIGEALGIHADNDPAQVLDFIKFYGLNADDLVQVPSREDPAVLETRTVYQALVQNIDILGKVPKRFYEQLAEYATDEAEQKKLAALGGKEGADDFKHRSEIEMCTYTDILAEFASARPSFHDLVRLVAPLKRREYSIASAQAVTPNSVSLMIVVVDWVDSKGRTRLGQATRYLSTLPVGAAVTVSVKPSVMKLPVKDTAPLIMAGLGTGLAPFRAFVQYRAMQKAAGKEIGSILLYMGSRHQREEYLYGEEWEAYVDAGVITLLGAAFSRDQPQKIYIQDRMRESMQAIVKAYIEEEGSFYLCGPTWPVPDVTAVLQEAIDEQAKTSGKKVDSRKEIERLKDEGRYVLEVY
ncbi:sulfite reductase [NADPH] flavoprotein component [Gnomoniopsis smithogilvyi]|uniref:assimilatory sulfite reductase (NADPH) n=1 Tax=Gnomoniopsis smithogilvyi TaxID=1191159 RepID=A0A9W8YY80_9PEZI|nr:sulfite reductase [NADPH] flavoprotein component [Gnomoniopsis smithogilvyi]